MQKFLKDVLPAISDKLQHYWSFWITLAFIICLVFVAGLRSLGLAKKTEDDEGSDH